MTKLKIALNVPGLPFHHDSLTEHSLGGSETAGLSLAKALAKRGHRIFLFCNSDKYQSIDNIDYLPHDRFKEFVSYIPHDVCIVQRQPSLFRTRTQSKLNVLWQHDMALGRVQGDFMAALWNIDAVALLSPFHIDQYKKTYGEKAMADSLIFETRNGIDLSLVPPASQRDLKHLVYSARPERGLDYLLVNLLPKILEADPEFHLTLSSYDNPAPELAPFYQHCQELIAGFGDRITQLGHLTKPDLYQLYRVAGCYVYPTPSMAAAAFREISCITTMECMATGLPFVSTDAGALPDTLHPEAGYLVDALPGSPEYDDLFVQAVLDYANDPARHERASQAGQAHAKNLSWDKVAEQWESALIGRIRDKSSDPARLATFFRKTGQSTAGGHFGGEDDVFRGEGLPDVEEPQVQMLMRWLAELPAGSRVLDYSGALIECPTLPDMPDIRLEALKTPGVQGNPQGHSPYDAVLLVNSLEYSDNPREELALAESLVKPGGYVLAVAATEGLHPGRRTWNLDNADIEDLAQHRQGFDFYAMNAGIDPDQAFLYIWKSFRYIRDEKEPGVIDEDRKSWLQGPRETLSAIIIAGGEKAEESLHWCLRPLMKIADEVLIGDCGMSDEARRIARQYPKVKLVDAPNPLEAGFADARNAVLEQACMDWVLWIDTDERLINGEFITKYLRNNVYDGYSIRQHHFGVDIDYPADLPVRLFRRGPQRFFGCIHEHPEKKMNEGPGLVVTLSDVQIMHIGYDSESTRLSRFARNSPLMEMDKKRNPDRMLLKHFTMRDNMINAESIMVAGGGQVTEDVRALCQETIDVWRENFKGGSPLVGIDCMPYYSRACELLNLGIDVAFSLEAGKAGYGSPIAGSSLRFADKSDLEAYMKQTTERATEHFLREDF